MFTIFAGIYYWFPKMTGRMYNERLGKLHFWLTFIGFNATFFPMHWVGLQGMPRRVADYSAEFGDWNLFISISAFLLGASTLVFLYNLIVSWARGPRAPANPWRAHTLEWQVSLAAAALQLRRDSAGRRRPVRVRRPRREARGAERRARAAGEVKGKRSRPVSDAAQDPRRRERDAHRRGAARGGARRAREATRSSP